MVTAAVRKLNSVKGRGKSWKTPYVLVSARKQAAGVCSNPEVHRSTASILIITLLHSHMLRSFSNPLPNKTVFYFMINFHLIHAVIPQTHTQNYIKRLNAAKMLLYLYSAMTTVSAVYF